MTRNVGSPLSERLRRIGFQVQDRLRTHRLAEELFLVKNYHSSPSSYEEARRRRLHDLLQDARAHVPYYREILSGNELGNWPVVTKDMIRREPERFQREGFGAATLTPVRTSGSSGQPFECFHEPGKVRRKLADLLYFNGLVGYRLGMRHMLIRATPKPNWKLWLQNEIWVDPTRWDEALRASMRASLLRSGVRMAIGYPSVMADLAAYCRRKGDAPSRFSLQGYIATSEMVWGPQRDLIRSVFGCRVVSRYASEEFGVVGQSDDDCESFHLNTGSLVIEVLDSQGQPVEPNTSGRVVVTDLTMRQMPLIRYDLGDLAVVGEPAAGGLGVRSISSLEGKRADTIYDSARSPIAPLAILVALKEARDIKQFQFAQTGARTYELRLSPETARVEKKAYAKLSAILGADAEVRTRKMSEIPVLPSGKRPVVVNEWKGRPGTVGCDQL